MSARCLSTYGDQAEEGYCAAALRRMADGRRFPHKLDFSREQAGALRARTVTHMSISGVQDKLSLRLHRGTLSVVSREGQYILKPVPSIAIPERREEVPANESLTMQLAEQMFGIDTAANALIRLADGGLAYITRRFDRRRDGSRVAQEDFCQLMKRSPHTHGVNFKYDASYEEVAATLRRFCGAYSIESEKLFRRIVFNYLVGNGDAHLKNFSLQQTEYGDYVLSPAYDLIATALHFRAESRLALDLLAGGHPPPGLASHGFETGGDFLLLARRMGLDDRRAEVSVDDVCAHVEEANELVRRSFLSEEAKEAYLRVLEDRRQAIRQR